METHRWHSHPQRNSGQQALLQIGCLLLLLQIRMAKVEVVVEKESEQIRSRRLNITMTQPKDVIQQIEMDIGCAINSRQAHVELEPMVGVQRFGTLYINAVNVCLRNMALTNAKAQGRQHQPAIAGGKGKAKANATSEKKILKKMPKV